MTILTSPTDFEVLTHEKRTVREIKPGDLFISTGSFDKFQKAPSELVYHIRRKTKDPFYALTLLGSRVACYPSSKCHPVREIVE